jgi:RNA polymerase sigma factor (sigma-70 family)
MPNAEKSYNFGREANAEIQKKVKVAGTIFDEYGDQIHAIIRFKVSNRLEADDIFQDFFLSLVHKPVPEGIQDIKNYLYRAIINDIIDMARRTKSYQARIHRYSEYRKYNAKNEDPQNMMIQAEEVKKMFQMIERQLPPREAQTIFERYGHDRSIGNASKRMHVSKKTFSRYLCMGLKKIRQLLREGELGINNL